MTYLIHTNWLNVEYKCKLPGKYLVLRYKKLLDNDFISKEQYFGDR